MAMGRSRAHSKTPRPGKRHMLVSQAVPTPPIRVPTATPAMSSRELVT